MLVERIKKILKKITTPPTQGPPRPLSTPLVPLYFDILSTPVLQDVKVEPREIVKISQTDRSYTYSLMAVSYLISYSLIPTGAVCLQ